MSIFNLKFFGLIHEREMKTNSSEFISSFFFLKKTVLIYFMIYRDIWSQGI